VIVTVVPPAVDPDEGDTVVIVGVPTKVKADGDAIAPPEPVRVTVIVLAATAGVTTVTEVALTLVIVVPDDDANVTAEVPVKLVPVIVTVVPPAVGPEGKPVADDTEEIVGAATYVKAPLLVTDPLLLVNATSTAPAALAGVTTVIDVALEFTIDVPAVPPKVTEVVPVKLVPAIVTVVPPAVGPDSKFVPDNTEVIVGAAA